MGDKLRILIADDTAFYRRVVRDVLATIPDVELVAAVADGRQAVDRIAEGGVQLAILDIEMPVMDGLSAVREISQRKLGAQVAILSGVANARGTMEALALGAIELIRKPDGGDVQSRLRASLERVTSTARGVIAAQERRRARVAPAAPALAVAAPPLPIAPARWALASRKFDLVLIGVSTGGPRALAEVIPALPADLPCPVLVVQHMSAGFTASLAESLGRASHLQVKEAATGDAVVPGRVLLAPGGLHVELERGTPPSLRTTEAPPVNGCRPAVDVLWNSVAANFRGEVLGVVLTGMGRDGRDGVKALRMRGAYCVAQDEPSSVVWGMPGAVVEAGLADEVLALGQIGERIVRLVAQGRRA